ncbi:MAG: hypothetical protein M1827_005383 [Pycnora praestabilis]|nr:MAG: hypothetical protein M1827_005383 [Pycnora praestabilis]
MALKSSSRNRSARVLGKHGLGRSILRPKEKPANVISTSGLMKHGKCATANVTRLPGRDQIAKETLRGIGNPDSAERYGIKKSDSRGGDHPLSLQLDKSIESWSHNLPTTTALNSCHLALEEHLTEVTTSSKSLSIAHQAAKEGQLRPIDQEELALITHFGDTSNTETALLGDRMRRFRTLAPSKEKELEAYWKKWSEIQDEISSLEIEVLGTNGPNAKTYLEGDSSGRGDDANSRAKDDLVVKYEKVEMDFAAKKRMVEKEVSIIGQEMLATVVATENKLKLQKEHQQRRMVAFMVEQL